MNETKHTPGPWKVDYNWAVKDYLGGLVCSPNEANARLIAAAPEMLEALKGLVQLVDAHVGEEAENWNREARAAIAKATGRA